MWNRDAYGTPTGTNLYGSHPVYFDHRGENGTHGVFLASSQGMDIKIDDSEGQYLEYNTLGGVFDFYFLAGPGPKEVAAQYSALSGLPAMMPYWGFGSHQCKYGYRDVWEVAEVVANYSAADIPLEVRLKYCKQYSSLADSGRPCGQTSTTWSFAACSLSTPSVTRLNLFASS